MLFEFGDSRFDRETLAIVRTAVRLEAQTRPVLPSPASMAWASLGDPRIRAWWGKRASEAESAFSDPALRGEPGELAWTVRALMPATARAMRRHGKSGVQTWLDRLPSGPWGIPIGMLGKTDGVRISRGDLLYGLASDRKLEKHFEGTTRGFYGHLDEIEPDIPSQPADWNVFEAAPGARVSIVFDNDPVTTMVAVVELLERAFGFSRAQAALTMTRIDAVGNARVVSLPPREAREIYERVIAIAREVAPTLEIRCVSE